MTDDKMRFLTIIAEEYKKAGGSLKIAAGILAGQNYGVGANILHAAMSRAYELDRGVNEEVEQSCGCVFCDLNLEPKQAGFGGSFYHHVNSGGKDKIVWCSKIAAFPNAKEPGE